MPFDRGDPGAGTIPIAYELYGHSDPGPAVSTILINFGGPGASATAQRDVAKFWLAPALDRHDLLLIDPRGTGRSGAIDCPDYQHGTAPTILAGAAGCAAQLGAAATRYSTRDIAADYEAVRAALRIEVLDLVGGSYGGVTAAAYATRYPTHLRSVILNAPAGDPRFEMFAATSAGARRVFERVGEICARSRDCGRSKTAALAAVIRLVDRLRRAPLDGTADDADGNARHVTLDATYLLVHILDSQSFSLVSLGELPAAIDALDRGDTAPLLRLAAEGAFDIPGDNGDPAQFSQGANSATNCVDQPRPWSPTATLPTRQAQYADAVARADDAPFAPFRASEIMFSPFGGADFCLPWPQTGTTPPVAPDAHYPRVPTLVLNGEFDLAAQIVRKTARLWPDAQVITFKGTIHTPLEANQCAVDIAATFVRTLTPGDTTCASRSPWRYPGATSFPRAAADSPTARRRPGDRSGPLGRRVARVAADTALDALKRSLLSNTGDYHGLRGGTIHTDYGQTFTTTLSGARWTDDVAVSGAIRWSSDDGHLDADLQVDGPGRTDGALHLHGGWFIPSAPTGVSITGTLAGRRVVAVAPSD